MKTWCHIQRLQTIILPALLLACIAGVALAQGPGYSYGDGERKNVGCMACHSDPSRVGKARVIDPMALGHTTHGRFGCTTCHDTILPSHPDGRRSASTTNCGDCHGDVVAQYARDYHSQKASCVGCHNPHRVYSPEEISGDEMNRVCGGCHRKYAITAAHARWLPQTELHLESITCVTCHSKAENYVITVYIVKRQMGPAGPRPEPARYEELKKLAGGDNLRTLIDGNRDNYVSLNELRTFNRNPAYESLYLKGMLTPVKPTHSFQTFDNRWNCTFCHASGPQIMQTSFVAFPEQDGTYRQVAVERGAVLEALHTIPNFYLMGSARNDTLNKVGLIIIAGGMIMPVGHGFLRFLTRKNRP